MAIQSSAKQKMTLAEIYEWITENFPYYRDIVSGWKVRVSNGTGAGADTLLRTVSRNTAQQLLMPTLP